MSCTIMIAYLRDQKTQILSWTSAVSCITVVFLRVLAGKPYGHYDLWTEASSIEVMPQKEPMLMSMKHISEVVTAS